MPIAFNRFDCAGPVWRSVKSSTSRRVRKSSGMALELGDLFLELLDRCGRLGALHHPAADLRDLINGARIIVARERGHIHRQVMAQSFKQAWAHAVTSFHVVLQILRP